MSCCKWLKVQPLTLIIINSEKENHWSTGNICDIVKAAEYRIIKLLAKMFKQNKIEYKLKKINKMEYKLKDVVL